MFDFAHHATEFSLRNAHAMATLSELAYDTDRERVQKKVESFGFDGVDFFDHDGSQALVAYNRHAIVGSFRGTQVNEIQDLVTDIKVKQVGGPLGGEVHRGFLGALLKIWEPHRIIAGMDQCIHAIRQEYADKNGGQKPAIWFTGHSLGAALATLAAAFMAKEDIPVWGLYTFGSPRVGDEEFSRRFNEKLKRVWRIVNNADVVTRVPPRRLRNWTYSHVGDFTYLTELGNLDHDPAKWFLWLDIGLGLLLDINEPGIDAIKDHGVAEYVRILSNLIDKHEDDLG